MKRWLAVLLLLLTPAYGRGAVTFVQGVANDGSSPVTQAFSANVSAGDFLILFVAVANTTGSAYPVTVSDNVNGAWTDATNANCFASFASQTNIFYFSNAGAGATTVTITPSPAASLYYVMAEYSGVATSSPFDVLPTCDTHGSTSYPTPSITTTNANDGIIAATAVYGNPGTVTVGSPFTLRVNTSGENVLADDIVTSTGTYQATFTLQFGNSGAAAIAAVKQAGAAAASRATQVGAMAVGP